MTTDRRKLIRKIAVDISKNRKKTVSERSKEEAVLKSISTTEPDGSPRDVRDQFMEYARKKSGSDNPVFYVPPAGPLQIGNADHLTPGDRAILDALSSIHPAAAMLSLALSKGGSNDA